MKQIEVNTGIADAFLRLYELNTDLYDYYMNRLYTVDGDFAKAEWNEQTLTSMEEDVMHNTCLA